jgi:transposase
MLHLSATCKYYLCRTPVDMRKGFDSLSGMVTNQMGLSVLSGALFIFFNKNHNQVKLLLWEGDGFSIYYKCLEKGTYECPTTHCADISISHEA